MTTLTCVDPMTDSQANPTSRFMLWIDGVGSFLLCVGSRVSVGGPRGTASDRRFADIAFLANLSRVHATFVRTGDSLALEAHGETMVNGRAVRDFEGLANDSEIVFGSSVRTRVTRPSELSLTTCMDVLTHHRLEHTVDGIILFADTCLLGPSTDSHVRCADWPESVLLTRRDGRFFCRSRADLVVGDAIADGLEELPIGTVVSGKEIRFCIDSFD